MYRKILPLLLLAIGCATMHAQARLAVYGTVGAERDGQPYVGWTGAGTFGLYLGLHTPGPLALSVDARADLANNIKSGLFGPRLALRLPHFPVKPYAEVLVGVATYAPLPDGLQPGTRFAVRAVGGIDTAILPHIDWRVIDFSYGIATDTHPETLSTGLVVRF